MLRCAHKGFITLVRCGSVSDAASCHKHQQDAGALKVCSEDRAGAALASACTDGCTVFCLDLASFPPSFIYASGFCVAFKE